MAIEDLEREGILLPREQWGKHKPRSRVAKLPLLAVVAVAVASVILMYTGDGHTLTWVGFCLFLASFSGFTWVSLRGIK